MIKNPIDALRRADRAVIGAFVVILATAGAALAYAPHTDEAVATRPPARALNAAPAGTPVPMARSAVLPNTVRVVFAPTRDQVSTVAREIGNPQTQCLAQAIYYEARGESVAGRKAIAEVIFNRIHSGLFPRSICGVVLEGAGGVCQFSFECDGQTHVAKEPYEWVRARVLAAAIVSGVVKLRGETDGAVAYHATYVDPDWGDHLVRTVQIGNHIFYRFANRHWLTRGA